MGDRQQIPGRWELKAFQGLRHVRPAGSGLERPSTITVTDDHLGAASVGHGDERGGQP